MILLLLIANFFGLYPIKSDTIPSDNTPIIYSLLTENQHIEVSEDYEVTKKVEQKFVLFSPEGLDHAYVSIPYDKLIEIQGFELEITDPLTGKTIQKAKLKDMGDAAIYSTMSIFDDNRRKYYEVRSSKFPVQVKISYETKASHNFYFPAWIPVHRYNQKVNQSTLSVTYPEALGLRYKAMNLLGTREEEQADGKITITWKEEDLPVQTKDLKKEDDHRLLLAPVNFAVGEFSGKMEDWAGLAAWQYALNKGRNVLPEEFKTKLREMVAHTDEPYERIKILYDYLQKNYRYVSIQLGIGGWQTMTAEEVVKYEYGDCKGLTNLMKSMLETVGISSNYTLVRAGADADDIEADLPSNQFNHVILQVPLQDGANPVWLECTSNSLPAGYLGDFTKDRNVLVINENGGYLAKTPSYSSPEWNTIQSQNEVKIDQLGNASIVTKMKMDGNFAAELLNVKTYLDTRQQRDYFNRNSAVSGLIIDNYELNLSQKDSLINADLNYEGIIQKFVRSTAKRTILKPFLGKITSEHLANNSLDQQDEYLIEFYEDVEAEKLSDEVLIDEEGILFSLKSSLEGRNLKVNRIVQLNLPETMTDEDKEELIKRINNLSSVNYYFNKSTNSNE